MRAIQENCSGEIASPIGQISFAEVLICIPKPLHALWPQQHHKKNEGI